MCLLVCSTTVFRFTFDRRPKQNRSELLGSIGKNNFLNNRLALVIKQDKVLQLLLQPSFQIPQVSSLVPSALQGSSFTSWPLYHRENCSRSASFQRLSRSKRARPDIQNSPAPNKNSLLEINQILIIQSSIWQSLIMYLPEYKTIIFSHLSIWTTQGGPVTAHKVKHVSAYVFYWKLKIMKRGHLTRQ